MSTPKTLKELIVENEERKKVHVSARMDDNTPDPIQNPVVHGPVAEVIAETAPPALAQEIERTETKIDLRSELLEQVRSELQRDLKESVMAELREELLAEVVQNLNETLAVQLFERIDQSNTMLVEAVGKLFRKIDALQESMTFTMPTPIINVTVPQKKVSRTVIRDDRGLISGIVDENEE